ncbi:LppU/SCO3897 family protein [Yinghuangia soli]|uniref:Uncharacterized protein n=1 Tax=Yinghuangia soli TaxID=2908204 RepID=A0AA41Q8K1_9ACTN|nr:hypothetical protein [Yinghuangia soli]MCF2532182.1 hypothetical protein [Yinghuangia soli]
MSNPFGPGPSGPGDQNPYGQQQPYGGQPQQPYGQPQQQPYPGQPQQPYGQQPYPGGPMPGGPMPGAYGQPPRRRKKWPFIVGGIIAAIVVLGVVGYFLGKDDATNAGVGDCLTAAKDADDMKKIGCDSESAKWRVIEKFEDTTDGKKCLTDEIKAKGFVTDFQWSGANEGVLCLTITKNTTLEDVKPIGITSQQVLDEARDTLADMGVQGVK